ncbi:MAG: glycosyltransferase family 2 protein [Nocardioidaceae bacterium]|nr:glycosyltransferase family 2 protein [Nocardioidaceae bacterium]
MPRPPTTAGVVAVVLNYDDRAATISCVESLLPEPGVSSVVVVDNDSPSGAEALADWCATQAPRVRFVAASVNGGFGAGMNLGLRVALREGPASVLLLNNDTVVATGAVARLQAALDADPRLAVAVPVVTTGTGAIWAAGGTVDPRTLRVAHRHDVPAMPTAISFAPGAALLVRSSVLAEVGGFVEDLFLYWEDVELSLRITDAGWRMVLVPGAEVWHQVQGGSPARAMNAVYYRTRNSLWVARARLRSGRLAQVRVLLALRALRVAGRAAGRSPSRALTGLRLVARGVRDGLRPGTVTLQAADVLDER